MADYTLLTKNPKDKSLLFFNEVYKNDLSKRSSTSDKNASKSNSYKNTGKKDKDGKDIYEFDVQVNVDYYDNNDTTKIVSSESKVHKVEAIMSSINDNTFLTYSSGASNNETSKYPMELSNVSAATEFDIIKWSEKYPSIHIKPVDLAYLKDFRVYPVNRFMVLRRFPSHSNHNLFTTKAKPISTLVGYYDLQDSPIKMSFGEKWTTFNDTFFNVIQDIIGIQFDSIPGMERLVQTGKESPFAQDFLYQVGKSLGFIGIDSPYGQANLIHEAAMRDVDGESLKTGLKTDFKFTFESVYEYRDIAGVNGKDSLQELIQKCLKMGTSNAVFLAGKEGMDMAGKFFGAMKTGNISEMVKVMVSAITDILKKATGALKSIFGMDGNSNEGNNNTNATTNASAITGVIKSLEKGLGKLAETRYERYKWKVTATLGAISGGHTAPWHLTLGNPKAPWFSMGNLVLEDFTIEPTGELMYDDYPSMWKVTASLRNGRAMGSAEIYRCFKANSNREYSAIEKVLNIKVPKGSTVTLDNGITITEAPLPPSAEETTKNDTNNNPDTIMPPVGNDLTNTASDTTTDVGSTLDNVDPTIIN